ncbi:MAG: Gfo/Idh/MocA family oxidoreductase [Planctomycetales bacterium]
MSRPISRPELARPSRRDFLRQGTAAVVAGGLALNHGVSAGAFAGENNTLRVGLIGCGGRGTGAAAQALAADPNAKLVAMGDAFADRIEKSLGVLATQEVADRVAVDAGHRFTGFDCYKGVIESCDVVLLTAPPHFRPEHIRAAVEAGKHIFAEKPIATDSPGVRSVLESCAVAQQKGLSVVSGLCYRYDPGMRATYEQIHSGAVGEIAALRCSYFTSELWHHERQPDWSDMEWQVRNWLYFTWLSGDHIVEQHIHSLDKMAWALGNEYPVCATGTGGRQVRTDPKFGHIYDHFAVEYEYANGLVAFSRCRQQNAATNDQSDHVFGTKGTMDVMKHTLKDRGGATLWRYRGPRGNLYQIEHDELFASIRNGKPIDNGDYMAKSTLMAILGRMAAYSGKTVTWEEALHSNERLGPEKYEWGPLPVDPVAMPGRAPVG